MPTAGRKPSLDGCLAKLERAEWHIGMVKAAVDRGTQLMNFQVEQSLDADHTLVGRRSAPRSSDRVEAFGLSPGGNPDKKLMGLGGEARRSSVLPCCPSAAIADTSRMPRTSAAG